MEKRKIRKGNGEILPFADKKQTQLW